MPTSRRNHRGRFMAYAAAAALTTIAHSASFAQEAPISSSLEPRIENGRQIYETAQFARFAPQTALDLARQIPGFSITEVSTDRGLGEASQNVLINGQRLSGKSNDAQTVLNRIPVSSVVRLEVIDGATLSIAGLSGQVLNVITEQGGITGNFKWSPQFRRRIEARLFNGEISVAGKIGKADFTLGLSNNEAFRGGGWGPEYVRDASGNLLFTRDSFARSDGDRPRLAGTYSRTGEAGSILNVNLAGEIYRFRNDRIFDRFAPNMADIFEQRNGSENEKNFEGSADYEFDLGKGRLKLVGFHRYEHSPFKNTFRRDFTDGTASEGSRFDQVVDEGESVVRAEYKWKAGKADWQVSAEGAFNYLDAQSELFLLDGGGIYQPEPLPDASARVTEKRGQVILSYGRPLNSTLTLQAQVGGEYSVLTQTGANGLTRNFVRPKGLISLAWKASPQLDASFRLERKVGQLDFGSFLASVNVQNNNSNAGNPNLVPPQSWLASAELNRSLGKAGSVKLKIEGEQYSDVVDQIPISPTEEAPGNLKSANRLRGEVTTSFLLDSVGFKGAKLDFSGAIQSTSLRDPLTGERRPISESERFSWGANFRHDIPGSNWAWGVSGEDMGTTAFYRLDYLACEYRSAPFILGFVENKDVLGLKVRAQVMNLIGQTEGYREIFYVDRRDGPVDFTTKGVFKFGMIYRLQISGTF